MLTDADEGRVQARDAYSSAIFLALLVLVGQALRLGTAPAAQGSPAWLQVALAIAAMVSLAALLATRHVPREELALCVCALLIASYIPVSLCAATRWARDGRPFEAFTDSHVVMCSLGLVLPRSFRLGVAALVLLCLASLGIYAWLVASGTPRALLPSSEPGATVVATLVGAAVLVARKRRRDQTLAYLHVEAEATVLVRASTVFAAIREQLGAELKVLAAGLAALQGRGGASRSLVERARRAVVSLEGVRNGLADLFAAPRAAPVACACTGPLRPEEREFYARDAHAIARTMARMTLALCLLLVPLYRAILPGFVLAVWSLLGLVAAATVLLLQRTRPAETRDVALALAVTIPWFVILPYSQRGFALHPQPFEPLIAVKMGIVLMPLLIPRRWWIGVSAMLLLVAEALALFYLEHFDQLRDRIPASEPWTTLLYFLIGAALVLTREHRRVASLRRLRAEREVAVLVRHSALSLALLDQTGSPLQVLTISVGMLVADQPHDEELRRMEAAVRALASLREHISCVDPRRAGLLYPDQRRTAIEAGAH
jgi:hypothetical protein